MPDTDGRDLVPCPICGTSNPAQARDCRRCHAALRSPATRGGPSDGPSIADQPCGKPRVLPRRDAAPVLLCVQGDGIPCHQATLCNVSAGGLAVYTTVPCPEGVTVRLTLEIEGRSVRADGIVRYCGCDPDEICGAYQVGIEFLGPLPPLSHLEPTR